jgi:hypothetical protein
MDTYQAVSIVRGRSIVFAGDRATRDVYQRLVSLLDTNQQDSLVYKSNRIGSATVEFVELGNDAGGLKEFEVGRGNADALVIGISPDLDDGSDVDDFLAKLKSSSGNDIYAVFVLSFENSNVLQETCPDVAFKVQELSNKIKEATQGLILNNVFFYKISSTGSSVSQKKCKLESDSIDNTVFQILKACDKVWSKTTITGENIAVLIFFIPIVFCTFLLESSLLIVKLGELIQKRKVDSKQGSTFPLPEFKEATFVSTEGLPSDDEDLSSLSEFVGQERNSNNFSRYFDLRGTPFMNWYLQNNGRTALISFSVIAIVLFLCSAFANFGNDIGIRYANRQHSVDALFACTLLAVGAGYLTMKSSPPENLESGEIQILSRDQTEEWKGIMQIGFVLYHYFHAEETYNLIRIFIASYVWMTGYGNFFFFAHKGDFSFARVMKLVLRMNLLVMFLTLTMNTEYMLYYICCLHTFFFFVVYFTLLPLKIVPKEDEKKRKIVTGISLLLSFAFLTVLFEVPTVFNGLFGLFPWFYLDGSLYEWFFRSRLDHYATWFGMLVAFSLPLWKKIQFSVDLENSFSKRILKRSALLGVTIASLVLYWTAFAGKLNKYSYNNLHPYLSWIPIISYIMLRNSSSVFRTKSMGFLSWMGKITLETYLLQFHIWLADGAKTVLVFVENYPTVNFMFATLIYILCAYASFQATHHIIEFLIPSKTTNKEAIKRSGMFCSCILLCYGLGKAVESSFHSIH